MNGVIALHISSSKLESTPSLRLYCRHVAICKMAGGMSYLGFLL